MKQNSSDHSRCDQTCCSFFLIRLNAIVLYNCVMAVHPEVDVAELDALLKQQCCYNHFSPFLTFVGLYD